EGIGTRERCGPYEVRRVVRPGLTLGPDRAERLRTMCMRGSSSSFGVDMRPYWLSRPHYFDEIDEWAGAIRDNTLAGWHSLSLWRGQCGTGLYHDMRATLPGHRRTGIGALMGFGAWLRWSARTRSLPLVAFRTQNPIVLHMLARFSTMAY